MPIKGAKYRVRHTKNGKKIRLAFVNGHVVEAKNLDTGAVHTPSEFKADKKKRKRRKRKHK
jgi:hypothetical protein